MLKNNSTILLFISIIESIYIIYFLNYFKTTTNFAHPNTFFNNFLFHHHIGKTKKPRNMICPFGHIMSWLFSVYLIFRYFNFNKNLNNKLLIISGLLSLINFNVLVYLIPIFFIEIIITQNLII